MEAKIGVIYTGVEKIGRERRRLGGALGAGRYAATLKGSELLGKLVYAQASKLGVERVGRLRLLGDGAKWIDTVGDEHFWRAKRILDLWHLERQVSRGLKAAIDDRAELTRQRATVSQLIRRGQADQVLTVLRGLAAQKASVGDGTGIPKELAATITYVEEHRHAIVDYEVEQAAEEHVG